MPDVKLHTVEYIVTPGPSDSARRMRVPGGWLYWVELASGSPASAFVPDVAPDAPPPSAVATETA